MPVLRSRRGYSHPQMTSRRAERVIQVQLKERFGGVKVYSSRSFTIRGVSLEAAFAVLVQAVKDLEEKN